MRHDRLTTELQEALAQARSLAVGNEATMDMTRDVSDEALQMIAQAGYDPVYGARPRKRAIAPQIDNPLSTLLLSGCDGSKGATPLRVAVGELILKGPAPAGKGR